MAEATLEEMQEERFHLLDKIERMEESMADVILRMEDLGWQKLMGEVENSKSIPLSTVKTASETARSVAVLNPLVVRGISVRTAYIWGNGVNFVPKKAKSGKLSEAKKLDTTSQGFFDQPNVKKWLASDQAWQEMEKALSTDGNFFMLVSKNTVTARGRRTARHDIQRIPIDQIDGVVTHRDNQEDIWFYKRQWTRTSLDGTGDETMEVYYPAIDYDDNLNTRPDSIADVKVDWDSRVAHRSVNKQTGWKWGVPTLWSIMPWAKAHKEFLETQLQLTKAYARFAFKATAPTAGAAKSAAAKVAAAPGTDPYSGNPNQIGGAFFGAGINLQAVGKPGGAVDFEAGKALAGYVAAGLSVPLSDLLADAAHANRSSTETVFESNAKVMEAEQAANKVFFDSIFEFLGLDVHAKFPPINKEVTYRQVQAIAQASSLFTMSAAEIRTLLLDAFGLEGDEWDPEALPTEEELGNLILEMQMQKEQIQAQVDAPLPGGKGVSPSKGNAPGGKGTNAKPQTANASYGDNGHRDAVGQHKYSNGNNG